MNGGPQFKFTEAVSFVINCETQEEIDYYWEKLTAGGGEEVQCGWLADKYGLSWQVVPAKLAEWARDAAGLQRVMHGVDADEEARSRERCRRRMTGSNRNAQLNAEW